MNRRERGRRALLEQILGRHTASEVRCMADLKEAGFRFGSIEEAYVELRKAREQQVFTARQMEIALAVAGRK